MTLRQNSSRGLDLLFRSLDLFLFCNKNKVYLWVPLTPSTILIPIYIEFQIQENKPSIDFSGSSLTLASKFSSLFSPLRFSQIVLSPSMSTKVSMETIKLSLHNVMRTTIVEFPFNKTVFNAHIIRYLLYQEKVTLLMIFSFTLSMTSSLRNTVHCTLMRTYF